MPEDRPGTAQNRQYGGLSPPSSQISDETLAWVRRKRPEAYEERQE